MAIASTDMQSEHLWYLEFSENQLLQALANLSDNALDPKVKARVSAHMEEVGDLIERRRQFFHNFESVIEVPRSADTGETEP